MKRLKHCFYILLILMLVSCAGNDFHYDLDKQAIVSNHGGLKRISINVKSLKNELVCECSFNSSGADSIYINSLPSFFIGKDTACFKSIYRSNTFMTIRNAGGDAGPFTIKLSIDSNRRCKLIN